MDEKVKTSKGRARRKPAEAAIKPQTPVSVSKPAVGDSQCPFARLNGVIDWLNVVDDFRIAGHQNPLPRWGFVMLMLLYFAVT